jgi:RNA polymerase sigma factor (sigma-70 family)
MILRLYLEEQRQQELAPSGYAPLLHPRALRLRLGPRLRRRLDPADLAQEALIRAHQNLAGFRGRTEAELVAWLQEILAHTLINEVRRARARKRDLAREQPLSGRGDSSCPMAGDLASAGPAPWERAEREDQRAGLLAALAWLPVERCEVLTRRGIHGASGGRDCPTGRPDPKGGGRPALPGPPPAPATPGQPALRPPRRPPGVPGERRRLFLAAPAEPAGPGLYQTEDRSL